MFLELDYSFPVPPNACLHHFSATFASRRMEGTVKEKEQAKQEFKQAVSEGRQAAMGALTEDPNVMKICIGNIAPSEEVRIDIALTEELPISMNTFYRYNLKSTLHPQLNKLAEELLGVEKSAHEWSCRLRVRSARKILAYQSSSHTIELQQRNDADTDLAFTVVPTPDLSTEFVFLYSTEAF